MTKEAELTQQQQQQQNMHQPHSGLDMHNVGYI